MAWQHCANCSIRSSDQVKCLRLVIACPINLLHMKKGDTGRVCEKCYALILPNLRETARNA